MSKSPFDMHREKAIVVGIRANLALIRVVVSKFNIREQDLKIADEAAADVGQLVDMLIGEESQSEATDIATD